MPYTTEQLALLRQAALTKRLAADVLAQRVFGSCSSALHAHEPLPVWPDPEDLTRVEIAGVDTEYIQAVLDTSDATATQNDILLNKTAYVDGDKITGALVPPVSSMDGTATAQDILLGETAYAQNEKITGELVLNGDATASDVVAGKTFYKDDAKSRITGTLVPLDTSDATAIAADIASGKTAYVNGVKVDGVFRNAVLYAAGNEFITLTKTEENDADFLSTSHTIRMKAKGGGGRCWAVGTIPFDISDLASCKLFLKMWSPLLNPPGPVQPIYNPGARTPPVWTNGYTYVVMMNNTWAASNNPFKVEWRSGNYRMVYYHDGIYGDDGGAGNPVTGYYVINVGYISSGAVMNYCNYNIACYSEGIYSDTDAVNYVTNLVTFRNYYLANMAPATPGYPDHFDTLTINIEPVGNSAAAVASNPIGTAITEPGAFTEVTIGIGALPSSAEYELSVELLGLSDFSSDYVYAEILSVVLI